MSPTLLEQIKEANKRFLAGSPQLLESSGDPFIVVTCVDSRLTELVEPALGLPRHRAMVIRTAGNTISEASRDVLRSMAAGIFLKGGKEIFVTGHTDCALSNFSAPEVIESFRAMGVPRTAFGDEDLRTWFGAFNDVKSNVLDGVAYLRKSSLVPRGMKVHGLVIGSERGEIEVVFDGDAAPAQVSPIDSETAAPAAAAKASAGEPPPGSTAPPPASKGSKGPVVIAAAGQALKPPSKKPESVLDAAMVLRDFVARERKNAQFERTVAQIDALLKKERDPIRIVAELERIVDSYKVKYPDLPGALEFLKKSFQAKGASGLGFKELLRRMLE